MQGARHEQLERLGGVLGSEGSTRCEAHAHKRMGSGTAQQQRDTTCKVSHIGTALKAFRRNKTGTVLQVNAPSAPGAQKSGFRDIWMQQPPALLSLASAGPSSPYLHFYARINLLSALLIKFVFVRNQVCFDCN